MDTPEERLVAMRGAGQFIGEMSLLNPDGLRTASARVMKQAHLLELSRADFNTLIQHEPALAYGMLAVLSLRLQDAHNKTIQDLREKNRELTEAYENLKAAQEQIIEKRTLERELMQAREIQESMLPTVIPQLEGLEVGVSMVPARMVGGDFYDVIAFTPKQLAIVVGDVAGKGVPAALFMALTRSLVRVEAHPNASPERVLKRVNHHLLEMNATGLFVTILYGILDRESRKFTYVRAGHEHPLLWDAEGAILPIQTGAGQALGWLDTPALEPVTLTIPTGGGMLLMSDGVTEANDPQGNLFGRERLAALIPSRVEEPAQALLSSLMQELWDFQAPAPQADDITMIAVRVTV
jgi:sigma-B regulation protein RsbU (phosphoserine phosphatase)